MIHCCIYAKKHVVRYDTCNNRKNVQNSANNAPGCAPFAGSGAPCLFTQAVKGHFGGLIFSQTGDIQMAVKKILIAEDDAVVRAMVARSVEALGYSAICTPDGKVAFATLIANPEVCLLISDEKMPEMDGPELIKRVRCHQAFSELPIVVMSSCVAPEDISRLLVLGSNRFVAKPFTILQMQEAVDACIAEAKAIVMSRV
jgi:CheY-like chemotaxis protein